MRDTVEKYMSEKMTARGVFFCAGLFLLSACAVDSTEVDDSDLIADILVQNDNGVSSAVVNLSVDDLSGNTDVNLIRQESIFYSHNGEEDGLEERDDGEYVVAVPDNSPGLYTFTIVRRAETVFEDSNRPASLREIHNNQVFLPEMFQELQVDPVQTGSGVNISWRLDDTFQSVNGFSTRAAVESFSAIGICQNSDGSLDVAITDGEFIPQGNSVLLEIAVAEHLTQELGLSGVALVETTCEFDIQLVRDISGTIYTALNRDSTALGQVLQNLMVQWAAQ